MTSASDAEPTPFRGARRNEVCSYRLHGGAELSVFGSVARGDARPDSDVDLLYVRGPGNDLGMSYFALQEDLEKLFGRRVDLVPGAKSADLVWSGAVTLPGAPSTSLVHRESLISMWPRLRRLLEPYAHREWERQLTTPASR